MKKSIDLLLKYIIIYLQTDFNPIRKNKINPTGGYLNVMDITEFVDSSVRLSPASEHAVTEDVLLDIVDCLQNSCFLGDEGATIEERLTTLCDGRHPYWEVFQSRKGPIYINCKCSATVGGRDVEIALQFGVGDDRRSYALLAIMLDNRAQTDDYIDEFLGMIRKL